MGVLGLEAAKAPAGMRSKRFFAFLVDAMMVLVIAFILYSFTGEPDFFSVQAAMDAAEAAGGQNTELTSAVFTQFDRAWGIVLLIGFCYEAVSQLLTGGSTVGKLLMGLRTAPQNPERKRAVHALLLCVRSAVKMLSLYLFQGIPFIICCLTIFTNGECRTGFDMAVKSVTVARRQNGIDARREVR